MTGWKLFFVLNSIMIINYSSAQEWKKNIDSATVYRTQKNFDKAISFYIEAKKQLQKDSAATDTYALVNKNIGDLYYQNHASWFQ